MNWPAAGRQGWAGRELGEAGPGLLPGRQFPLENCGLPPPIRGGQRLEYGFPCSLARSLDQAQGNRGKYPIRSGLQSHPQHSLVHFQCIT
ncbi:hypothetical protein HPG69_012803 [Diceros bicornis minor]|uniref:Uncharacterized protein n=1 Tax=Diceros bicornis minor TaxID=77932 RepID=A0A7J7F0W5_DICBM|nr:hypothetical protein HPG69_012803 [Diceros bicornis minor]